MRPERVFLPLTRLGLATAGPFFRARRAIETFAIAGEQPLEVMFSAMRNPDLPPMLRFDAACKAAPYVHPKLASPHRAIGRAAARAVRRRPDAR